MKTSVNPGAYAKINFTGTSAALGVDVSAISGAGVAAKRYPRIRWSIDGGAYQDYQLASGNTSVSLATGLSAGTHTLLLWFLASDAYTARWNGTMALKVTGLTIDAGASVSAATLRSKRMLVFGDSITEGAWDLGPTTDLSNYSDYEDSTASWLTGVAEAFGAEVGNCSFGGQSWDSTFNSDVPAFTAAWDSIYSGHSRLSGGLLTPAPDYLLCNMGANGGPATSGEVVTWLGNVRTAAGSGCTIVMVVPFNGMGRTNITAGVAAYRAANPADPCYLVDLGNLTDIAATVGFTGDGLHPDVPTQGRIGAMVAKAIQQAIGGNSVFNPLGCTFIKGL